MLLFRSGKRFTAATLVVCFCLWRGSASEGMALDESDFGNSAAWKQWEAAHHVAPLRATPEGLRIEITGSDPFVIGPIEEISLQDQMVLRLRLRSEAGGFAQVFWFEKQPSEEQSMWFDSPKGRWTEVRLPLPITSQRLRLRIDPPGGNGVCTLACARFESPLNKGIVSVTATERDLRFILRASTGAVEIVELAPHQGYTDLDDAPVRARLLPQANRAAIARFDGTRDRIYSGFAAVRTGAAGSRSAMGTIRFVEDLQMISKHNEPFPRAVSKKGLQVQMTEDAIALGVKHAALNLNLGSLIDISGRTNGYTWQMDGQTYHFDRNYLNALPVKQLSDAGMLISLIILAYESGDPERDRILLHPRYDKSAPNKLGAFNTATADGLRHYKACLEFLADHFSRPDRAFGQVMNYIIGNEVNSHWHWYNLGRLPPECATEEYLRAVRVAHVAIRKASAAARVYLSLEHHWNIAFAKDGFRTLAGRRLLDHFNRCAKMGGDFDWHIAFHPYPENLFQPRTWQDRTATSGFETPRITFRNLEVLPRYLRETDLLYRGQPRRAILSEQGFHSDGTPQGEQAQAAAYCYAFRKASQLDGVDSFILHRHVDHRHEGGLNLGLWRRKSNATATPDSKKPIYEVFRAADTPEWPKAFEFALPIIGITNWSQIFSSH